MSAEDDERLRTIASALADRVDAVVESWIERLVLERVVAWTGSAPAEAARARARRAGDAARAELMPVLRRLLAADVDEQAVNPLTLLRAVTGHAAEALDDLGVAPVRRDRFAVESFPDDHHDLVPATWADVDPTLHEPGLAWGAAKAFVHRSRHQERPKETGDSGPGDVEGSPP